MSRQAIVVLYVLAMIAVVVGVDVAFFRNRFWERLAANIGIVLVFGAFYLKDSWVTDEQGGEVEIQAADFGGLTFPSAFPDRLRP